ncbi:MAG: SDR family NAD(P)-dependent oxidoreductase, partial [Planctomycetota bacterium JB042]
VRGRFERVRSESGRLDVLVLDVWGGDALTEWGRPFWELDLAKGRAMLERAVLAHLITARHGVPLLLEGEGGLVVEVTDGDEATNRHYRGQLFYDLAKTAPMRAARGMAEELRDTDVTAVCVTPGFLRSEAVLEHFGVTEETWRDAIEADPAFAESESPLFVGRAIAALAADPRASRFSGRSLASWTLAREYDLRDADGRRPDMGAWFDRERAARWPALVECARRGLAERGIDPDEALEVDADRLRLTLRPAEEGGAGDGVRWPVQSFELWIETPEKAAAAFLARVDRERDGG